MHFFMEKSRKKNRSKNSTGTPLSQGKCRANIQKYRDSIFFFEGASDLRKKNGRCCHCTELSPRIAKFSFCFDRIREKQSFDAGWSGIGSMGPFQRILAFWREKVKKSKKSIQIWDFGFELRMYLEAKLHAVPVTMVIWTLTGWLTCYLVAVGCGHVDPLLPLISMCGIRW